MSLRPPSGTPPPRVARIDGQEHDLTAPASQICARFYAEFPDEKERYGDVGEQWCRHDTQWVLSWAVDDVTGAADLEEQIDWLARVLHARGYPIDRLARNLLIAADVIGDGGLGTTGGAKVSQRLAAASRSVGASEPGGNAPPGDR